MYGIESYIAVPVIRRDGSQFGVLCALDPEPSDLTEGIFGVFTLLASLIAFELEADEQRQREQQQIEQDRREAALRDEFLASVAHDLKNPLTSIHGFASLAQRLANASGPLRVDRLLSNLAHIQRSAARMAASIDELMDLTRLRMDRSLELHHETIDLATLVRGVAAEQQQATDRHEIVVVGLPSLIAACDQARITRVIQNLIGNAIRYSPDGGTITVSVEQRTDGAESWALLRVTDEGLGIPPDDLPHIFEQFHRGANVVNRVGGTGIGLFSVQQVVGQHGGRIDVSSTEGQGSTFTVSLPIQPR